MWLSTALDRQLSWRNNVDGHRCGSCILGGGLTVLTMQRNTCSRCVWMQLCYRFTINDSFGDGICCAYGTGAYTLTSNGNVLASGGEFAATVSETICLGEGFGCTDPTCNRIPMQSQTMVLAIPGCAGCTDPAACNYDPPPPLTMVLACRLMTSVGFAEETTALASVAPTLRRATTIQPPSSMMALA